jgi:hypothetical protein
VIKRRPSHSVRLEAKASAIAASSNLSLDRRPQIKKARREKLTTQKSPSEISHRDIEPSQKRASRPKTPRTTSAVAQKELAPFKGPRSKNQYSQKTHKAQTTHPEHALSP